jgi:hypothetical protein
VLEQHLRDPRRAFDLLVRRLRRPQRRPDDERRRHARAPVAQLG